MERQNRYLTIPEFLVLHSQRLKEMVAEFAERKSGLKKETTALTKDSKHTTDKKDSKQ